MLGEGSFGQVVRAQHIATRKVYAIKLVRDIFDSLYECKKVLREIQILRQLSKMNNNLFTTKLHDIIIPDEENIGDAALESFN